MIDPKYSFSISILSWNEAALYLVDHLLLHQVTQGVNVLPVFCEIDPLLEYDGRYLEFDPEQAVARLVITLYTLVPRQETIRFHIELLIADLHDERGTQVNEVGIADIREKRIRKTFRVLFQQFVEAGFPKKSMKFSNPDCGFTR